ncbi:MAG: 16S rRNA processing protein RimM [Anaerolineae bacterium]|nr:16S rRNA processing protein RimM [Anaerolineae bacterium]
MKRNPPPQIKKDERGLSGEAGQPRFLIIGQVARPHGIRGELRADIHTEQPERFTWLKQVYLSLDEDGVGAVPYQVAAARLHQKQVLLQLAEVTERNGAEELRGRWLLVPQEEAIPLEEGEYYLYQVIGLSVYTDTDEPLGVLVEVIETGANNVFVVQGGERELLLPDIAEVVRDIDFERGRITVHLLPGLL